MSTDYLEKMYRELSEAYPFRVELHAHTSPASPCSEIPPEVLVEMYAEKKVDAVCITNHYTPALMRESGKSREQAVADYLEDYYRTKEAGEKCGIRVILGAELRFVEGPNDYLIFGIDEADIDAFYDYMGGTMQDFRQNWHKDGAFFLQAHPFRNKMTVAETELLDGMEVFNMHPNHNSRVGIAAEYIVREGLIPTVGTDFHHPGHQALGLLRAKTLPETSNDIAELLRSRDYLMETGGFLIVPPPDCEKE